MYKLREGNKGFSWLSWWLMLQSQLVELFGDINQRPRSGEFARKSYHHSSQFKFKIIRRVAINPENGEVKLL